MDKKDLLIILGFLVLIFYKDIMKIIKNSYSNVTNSTTTYMSGTNLHDNVFDALNSNSGIELMKSEAFQKYSQTPSFDLLIEDLSDNQIEILSNNL